MRATALDLARRARLRYIAAGDADGAARQERAITRAIAEQEHYDAAGMAGLCREQAMGDLARLHGDGRG